jgi:pimeloyl-ACP methyl ester carboxylesterase
MATFALIHGASANSGYWSRVAPLLEAAGHDVVAPDLPTGDCSATFDTYAQVVTDAIGGRDRVVVVGQSMGAFTAPIVATTVPTSLIVLVAPMIPIPGETPRQWGDAVGLTEAQQRYAAVEGFAPQFDLMTTFMHDVPRRVVEELMAAGEPEQTETIFEQPFPLKAWPDAPTRVLACTRDRMFPLELVRRLARQRLGVEPDEIDSGHLPGFSRPDELARKLLCMRRAPAGSPT